MIELTTPFSEEAVSRLKVGDVVSISGYIYTGRDAVLPKIVKYAEAGILADMNVDLQGQVISIRLLVLLVWGLPQVTSWR